MTNFLARLASAGLLLVLAAAPGPTQAGYRPGWAWPAVSTPFFHAATTAQAEARATHWRGQRNMIVSGYRDTGSMRPVLRGGRELLALEYCRPLTPLIVGMIVQFVRDDHPAVLHYIAAVSGEGTHVHLSGVNCRWSDGWFPRERVTFVVREIITVPESGKPAAVAKAG